MAPLFASAGIRGRFLDELTGEAYERLLAAGQGGPCLQSIFKGMPQSASARMTPPRGPLASWCPSVPFVADRKRYALAPEPLGAGATGPSLTGEAEANAVGDCVHRLETVTICHSSYLMSSSTRR